MTSKNHSSVLKLLRTLVKYFVILVLAIYIIIWAFSPYAVHYFTKPALQDLGVSLGENSSVRFNPFTSTLSIDELSLVDINNVQALTVEDAEISVHLHRLVFKQLYISEFSFKDVTLRVEKTPETLVAAGIDLASDVAVQDEAVVEDAVTSKTDFAVILSELQISNFLVDAYIDGVQQQVLVDDFSLSNVLLSEDEQTLELSLLAKVNGAPLNVSSSLAIKAGIGQVNSKFSLEQLALSSISPLLAEAGAQISGDLALNGAANLAVTQQAINVLSEQIVLSIDNLSLAYQPWIVEGQKDVITLTDLSMEVAPQGAINSLSANVVTLLEGGNLALDTSGNSLVNWQKIDLTTQLKLLDMQPNIAIDEVSVESLQLSNNKQAGNSSPLVRIEQLLVSDIKFVDKALSVNTVSLAGLQTDVNVNEDKSIAGLVDTSSLQAAEPEVIDTEANAKADDTAAVSSPSAEEPQATEQALVMSLQKFVLLDEALINVNDASVSPAFSKKIIIETLQAGPFDSANTSLKSPFELVDKDVEYQQIAVNGYVSPFAEKLNADFNGKINEVSLPSVSPYVKDALGFEMKSGQLDISFEINVADNELSGEKNLFLRGLEMSSADEFEQGTIKEGKAMPLNVALSMLKDDQGNIDLNVPIRGDISDPRFGMESFLGIIVKKAAMSHAKDYLMTTFVPYAQVVSVAISGAEYLLKVRFEPLILEPAQSSLNEANQQYLAQLLLLMQDKPELQLKTCAMSTLADIGASENTVPTAEQVTQLKGFGTDRQTNLKRYLVDQGIASSRVLFCAPELDTAVDAKPRIELKTD
jgi:hypothetical protein